MPSRLRTKADQNRLLLKIHEKARAFARGRVKADDVDDVASDVVLYCLRKLRSREWRKLPGNLQALVRTMVKARVADRRRKVTVAGQNDGKYERARQQTDFEWMTTDGSLDEASIDDYQADIMKKLPPRCRLAYYLVRVEGDTYGQAAERMQVTPRTICNFIVRAHRPFRDELQALGIDSRSSGSVELPSRGRSQPGEPRFTPAYVARVHVSDNSKRADPGVSRPHAASLLE